MITKDKELYQQGIEKLIRRYDYYSSSGDCAKVADSSTTKYEL